MRYEDLRQEASYAVRSLAKSPGFTATVLLTLGLAIGANAAVFSLIDALAWRTLPVADPGSLLLVPGAAQ
jgi:hypothetical protein